MRWLVALAVLLAAFVAALFLAMGVRRAEVSDGPLQASDASADPESLILANAEDHGDASVEAVSGDTQFAPAPRRPAGARRAEISGIVRFDDGQPASHAMVGLFAPAADGDHDASPFAPQELRHAPGAGGWRLVQSWTRADAQGRFRFEFPEPGRWIVRAEVGPLLATATPLFALEPGASRPDLVLHLPPAAWLEGHVDAPEVSVYCQPSEDRTYRLGPTEAGLHSVGFVFAAELRTRARPLAGTEKFAPVLRLQLPTGTTQRDIGLPGGFPGTIALTVSLTLTAPAPPISKRLPRVLSVRAEPYAPQFPGEGLTASFRSGVAGELGPVPPGDWRILVQVPEFGPWSWPVTDWLRVGAGERIERTFELEITSALVELLDARTGAPLDTEVVEVGRRDADGLITFDCSLETPGNVRLSLPPGDYLVTARKEGLEAVADDPSAWAPLSWSASGPSSSRLRVPR